MRIAIIGNIVTSGSSDVFLRKFLRILLPFAETIYIFSEWPRSLRDNRVRVVTHLRSIAMMPVEKSSVMVRLTRYFLVQLHICLNILKLAKHIQIVLTFDTLMVGPIFLAKLTRKKVVPFAAARTPTNVFPKGRVLGNCLRKIADLAKHVVFHLSDIIIVESNNLIYWLNLSKYISKLRVRSTFIDTDVFKPIIELNNRTNLVGYIGNLTESKGVKQFVKSALLITRKKSDVSFLIYGEGPCYKEIKTIITTRSCLDKIELKGWISHFEVPGYLNQLKLLVLPSETEGLPNIILESMACGTPVLATPVGGIPDIIKEGETGFLLRSNDLEHIAKRIVEILNKPELLEKVSVNAHNYVRENFSYEKTLETWRKILNELLVSK